MTDYTRQSIFTSGDVIKAEHGNAEFDQIAAFAAQATGHKHDGTSGEGAFVPTISDATNTDKVEIVTGGAKTTGTHQVTGALTADAGVAVTGDITVTGTVDGRDVAADGTTLDAVEAGATADQIASEVPSTPAGDLIATDVQAALNELDTEKAALAGAAFTGAITTTSTFDGRDVATDGTKLDGIETSAKDDQIASEVVSTPAGTLIATDVQAALNELDTEKAALAGAVFTGDVTTTNLITAGNVDGRDVSVDGTKLDTIETNAKDDQTAAEVVFTPTGLITSTDVQAAVAEVSSNIALQIAAKVHHNAVVDVNFAASPLSVLVTNDGNMLQVDTSGGNVVLTLPDSTGLSDDMRISVVKYTADANTVTVNRSGTDTINGATSQLIATQYEHVHFVLDQSGGEWIAAGGLISAINATAVNVTPTGNVTSTDAQAAIAELDAITPRKNLIIGGDFHTNPWQRGTSFSAVASGTYTADRFRYEKSGAMVHTVDQLADAPTVAQADIFTQECIRVDCTTIDATLAAGDFSLLGTKIEGYDWTRLAQRGFVLSFWHKHTKTGTYCVSLRNSGTDRSYVAEYTQTTTNTWEKATINVTASPVAGTWNYTNGTGIDVSFAQAAGSTFQTTAEAWQTGDFLATANQVNACDDVGNDFKLALIQMEAGDTISGFEQRSFVEEESLATRYFEKKTYAISSVVSLSQATNTTSTFGGFDYNSKRATPTLVITGTLGGLSSGGGGVGGTYAFTNIGQINAKLALSGATSLVAGNVSINLAITAVSISIDSEL